MSSTIPSFPHSSGASESTTSLSTRSPERRCNREWEKIKVDVWHLLTKERLPPEKIRDRLKAKGFDTTLEALKSRLRYWGLSGRTSIELKKYITHKARKRKREKKRSAIIVDGRLWSLAKIQKETSRNDYTSSELMRDPNPSTPPGLMVSVCSPPPNGLMAHETLQWPSELPWMRFLKLVSDAPDDIIGMMTQGLSGMRIASGGNGTLSQTMKPLHFWLPFRASDPIRLSSYLQATMPEAFQDEHLLRSQTFCTQSGGASRELFMWALYHISNNARDDMWICRARKDNTLLDLIDSSGLVGSKDPILAEPTVMSVLEKVWAAALRQCQCRFVSWISGLDTGLCQPACMPAGRLAEDMHMLGDPGLHNPLIITIRNVEDLRCCVGMEKYTCQRKKIPIHNIDTVIGVLLTRGVSPDEYCCEKHRTPLEWAVQHDYFDIVKTFLEHGVNTCGAGYLQTMDFDTLFCLMPEIELPQNRSGMMQYLQGLALKAFPLAGSSFGTLLTPEGLVRAAREGSPTLLRSLQLAGADFNCATPEGEFPLGVVIARRLYCQDGMVSSGRIAGCYEVLVGLGASVNYEPVEAVDQEVCPSSLHIASAFGDVMAAAFLILEGANQHTPARFSNGTRNLYGRVSPRGEELDSAARSPLDWALYFGQYNCAILLLNSGAPVDGHELLTLFETPAFFGQPPAELVETLIARKLDLNMQTTSGKTALDFAVLKKHRQIASILTRAGASSKYVTSSDIEALETHAWLDHYIHISKTRLDRSLLEEWFRLVPCRSVDSEHARLAALAACLRPCGTSIQGLEALAFVLQCYPHAYNSEALYLVVGAIPDRENRVSRKWLAIFHEFLKRRRPELVESRYERLALQSLVCLARDNDALEFLPWQLVSQEPLLSQMPSHPLDDPLLGLFRSFIATGNRQLILEKFLEFGFKVTTALGLCAISHTCSVSELEQLMELGFDPRRRYRWSHTALQYAVLRRNRDMVRFLLNHHASVNACPRWGDIPDEQTTDFYNSLGRTALQFAAEAGDLECSRLLVESGADVNAPPASVGGGTALQLVSMKGYIGIARWLISQGANVHAQGALFDGMTAIEGAAAVGKLDIVGLLLEHGNFSDGEGRHQLIRAVGYARKEGHQALRLYLEHQVEWTKEDEETLAQEDLGSYKKGRWWEYSGYRHRDCAGDWESVDEDMDEPDCCWEEDSSDGSQSPSESCSEDEELDPSREDFGLGPSEERPQEEAPALAYSAPFEEFWDVCVRPGIEVDSRVGETAPATSGLVLGEILENDAGLDGQDGGNDQWMEDFVNLS